MRFRLSIIVVIVLFVLGLVWGLSLPNNGVSSVSTETQALENLAKFINSLPAWAMFVIILLKNMSAVIFSFILSPLFLIVPVFSLVFNGWVIGVVSNQVIAEHSIGYLLAGLLPHGIFEIPALFIGEAAAVGFGITIMQAVVSRNKREQLPAKLKLNLKFLVISLVLFIPAALMETFVTPLLLR
jgi:stage II sporulation protein M